MFELFGFGKKEEEMVPPVAVESTNLNERPKTEEQKPELIFDSDSYYVQSFQSEEQVKNYIAKKLNISKLKEEKISISDNTEEIENAIFKLPPEERISSGGIELTQTEDTGRIPSEKAGEKEGGWNRKITYNPSYKGRPILKCQIEYHERLSPYGGHIQVEWAVS